jgi:hypothetical protein
MLINYNKTLTLLTEDIDNIDALIVNNLGRVDAAKDHPSISNKFKPRPLGIIIEDSYNNPFFPIRPMPRVDSAKIDLFLIYKRFRELYSQFAITLLPWHFVIEFIEDRFFVFNTRPVDMFFPVNNQQVINRQDLWDDITKTFMKNYIFDIKEALHILVVGDSNIDIYTRKFYELLGRVCIVPYVRYFRIANIDYETIIPLNMGRKFNLSLATKFVKR